MDGDPTSRLTGAAALKRLDTIGGVQSALKNVDTGKHTALIAKLLKAESHTVVGGFASKLEMANAVKVRSNFKSPLDSLVMPGMEVAGFARLHRPKNMSLMGAVQPSMIRMQRTIGANLAAQSSIALVVGDQRRRNQMRQMVDYMKRTGVADPVVADQAKAVLSAIEDTTVVSTAGQKRVAVPASHRSPLSMLEMILGLCGVYSTVDVISGAARPGLHHSGGGNLDAHCHGGDLDRREQPPPLNNTSRAGTVDKNPCAHRWSRSRTSVGADFRNDIWLVDAWTGEPVNLAPEEHDELRWFDHDHASKLLLADARIITLLKAARR